MVSRRDFLKFAGLSSAGIAGSLAGYDNLDLNSIKFEEKEIFIPSLPAAFQNYRVGYLSDLHLGIYVPIESIERALNMLRAAKPDILLLGGDYIWLQNAKLARLFGNYEINSQLDRGHLEESIFRTVADVVSNIECPDRIHAVFGNHDRWVDPKLCRKSFEDRGINFMVNDYLEIRRGTDRITLIGLDDYWTGEPKLPNLPYRKENNEVRVINAHNPDYVARILESGFEFDLAVCGHTHGGQIRLPLIGALIHNVRDLRFFEGLHKLPTSQVYTSRGVGVVELPLRINCPAEATLLHLKSA